MILHARPSKKSLLEVQFPIGQLSLESYIERKAGASHDVASRGEFSRHFGSDTNVALFEVDVVWSSTSLRPRPHRRIRRAPEETGESVESAGHRRRSARTAALKVDQQYIRDPARRKVRATAPPMPAKPRKTPKPTVLRDFFGSLDDKTKGLLLLTLNLEADSELSQKAKQEKLEAELLRRIK